MNSAEAPGSTDLLVPDCPICFKVLMDLKILPCGHAICCSCLATWLEAREMAASCPVCRYPILETRLEGYSCKELAEIVVDALPTDLVVKATIRGKHDLTPETCLGCEGLLCQALDTPHPLCAGHGDPKATPSRETEARASLKMLSAKLRWMVSLMVDMQAFLKDREKEFGGLAAVNETVTVLRSQAVQMVLEFQAQTSEFRTVLLTHVHLIDRLQESREVVATILMEEAMQSRMEALDIKMESFQGIVFRSLFVARQRINQSAGGQV